MQDDSIIARLKAELRDRMTQWKRPGRYRLFSTGPDGDRRVIGRHLTAEAVAALQMKFAKYSPTAVLAVEVDPDIDIVEVTND